MSQSWGIVIGGTILQNQVRHRLPSSFLASFPDDIQIAYAVIPVIPTLPEPLKTEVKVAFAESIALIWRVMIGFAGLGLLSCMLMREVEMRKDMDESWALQERKKMMRSNVPDIAADQAA